MDKLTTVKWCTMHLPMIKIYRHDDRLYLTKRELVELKTEITEFIEYYKDTFSDEEIDIEPTEDNI